MNASVKPIPSSTPPKPASTAELIDIRGLSESSVNLVRVSTASLYGDSIWDFRAEIGSHASRDYRVNFDNILMLDGSVLTADVNQTHIALFKQFVYTLGGFKPEVQHPWIQ